MKYLKIPLLSNAAVMLIAALLFCCISAKATDEEPCLVISGNSQTTLNVSLSTNTRIYFDKDRMRIHSGDTMEELLYSLYNHLEFSHAVPDGINDIQDMDDGSARIVLNADNRSLHIDAQPDKRFAVGVFGLNGREYLSAKIMTGENLSLRSLPSGTYIAAAVSGKTKVNLKFIIK